MSAAFDFVIVGGGSAGAVIAARLSEDPACRVALIEAGAELPPAELAPVAAVLLQGSVETDWQHIADPGKRGGLGLSNGRAGLAQGRMLGGSSGINLMAYVRGHPADFEHWADHGAAGWSYADVLPFFRKSGGLGAKDPGDHPAIRMNYYSDPHDLNVMLAALRRSLEIASKWPYKQDIGLVVGAPIPCGKTRIQGRRTKRCASRGYCTILLDHGMARTGRIGQCKRSRREAGGIRPRFRDARDVAGERGSLMILRFA